MDDDYEKLIKFFDESNEEKDRKLELIFQESMRFFEKYKYVLKEGTEADKIAIKKKMEVLRSRLQAENERNQDKLGLTSEEIKHLAKDASNFSPQQWEFLQKAQKEIEKEKEEHSKILNAKKEERHKTLKEKKTKRSSSKKSDWLKS